MFIIVTNIAGICSIYFL